MVILRYLKGWFYGNDWAAESAMISSNGDFDWKGESYLVVLFYFLKVLEDISPFRGATDTPVLDFWWRLSWVSKPVVDSLLAWSYFVKLMGILLLTKLEMIWMTSYWNCMLIPILIRDMGGHLFGGCKSLCSSNWWPWAIPFVEGYICDATETGGTPPVTKTNDTMPSPWGRQAALVWFNKTFLLLRSWWQSLHLGETPLPEETMSKPLMMLPQRETIEECPKFKCTSPFIGENMTS